MVWRVRRNSGNHPPASSAADRQHLALLKLQESHSPEVIQSVDIFRIPALFLRILAFEYPSVARTTHRVTCVPLNGVSLSRIRSIPGEVEAKIRDGDIGRL
jgi:hypothetical protein